MSEVLLEAQTLWLADRNDDAMRVLGPHLAAHPDDVRTLNLSAFILCDLGRPKEAKRNAEAAVAHDPDDSDSWRALAWALSRSNLHEKAFDAAERAVGLAPDSWRAHQLLAQVASVNYRRDAEALVAADRAVRLAPDEPTVRITLGNIWLARGRHGNAAKEFRLALRLDPQNPFAKESLVRTDLDAGRIAAIGNAAELIAERPTASYPVFALKIAIGDVINRVQGTLTVGILLLMMVLFGALIGDGLELLGTRLLLAGMVLLVVLAGALMVRASRRSLGDRAAAVLQFVRSQDRMAIAWAALVGVSLVAGLVSTVLPAPALVAGQVMMYAAGAAAWVLQVLRNVTVRGG